MMLPPARLASPTRILIWTKAAAVVQPIRACLLACFQSPSQALRRAPCCPVRLARCQDQVNCSLPHLSTILPASQRTSPALGKQAMRKAAHWLRACLPAQPGPRWRQTACSLPGISMPGRILQVLDRSWSSRSTIPRAATRMPVLLRWTDHLEPALVCRRGVGLQSLCHSQHQGRRSPWMERRRAAH